MPPECMKWTGDGTEYRRWVKTPVHVVDHKFTKFWHDARDPLVLSNALARLSMSCFVEKIFAIDEKPNNVKVFGPIFGRDNHNFSAAVY